MEWITPFSAVTSWSTTLAPFTLVIPDLKEKMNLESRKEIFGLIKKITFGVVNVDELKIERVSFLESLKTRSVDQVLDDVTLEQFSQTIRIIEHLVEL